MEVKVERLRDLVGIYEMMAVPASEPELHQNVYTSCFAAVDHLSSFWVIYEVAVKDK